MLRNASLALVILFCCSSDLLGQDSSSDTKPWWNPFSSSTSTTASQPQVRESSFFDGSNGPKEPLLKMPEMPSLPSMPKLPWSASPSSSKTGKKPASSKSKSMFRKMGDGTKKFWAGTVDMLNPFDSKPEKKQQGYQPQNIKRQSDSGGMFSWLYTEEVTETPTNVNEFLRLERPRF